MVNPVNPPVADDSPLPPCRAEAGTCEPLVVTNRIRELRLARRMTLVQTAKAAGTSVQQLSRLERSERRLTDDWMRLIAAALGVRPSDLLPEASENIGEFVQSPAELSLLRFWRSLSIEDKRWIIAVARERGFNLLNNGTNQPKLRRGRT